MAGKVRDFETLAAGLADLAGRTEKEKAPAPKGRPLTDTKPLMLRLSERTMVGLIKEAAEVSIREGKNITPQKIILRILEERYG